MTANRILEFSLCEECHKLYSELRYHADAEIHENTVPFATIYWDDEHPTGTPQPKCDKEACFNSISFLIAARCEYWELDNIPLKYEDVWETAKRLIPTWPGFHRLTLSKVGRNRMDKCFKSAEGFFSALVQTSNKNIEIQEKGSRITGWSLTIDLDADGQEII